MKPAFLTTETRRFWRPGARRLATRAPASTPLRHVPSCEERQRRSAIPTILPWNDLDSFRSLSWTCCFNLRMEERLPASTALLGWMEMGQRSPFGRSSCIQPAACGGRGSFLANSARSGPGRRSLSEGRSVRVAGSDARGAPSGLRWCPWAVWVRVAGPAL